MFLRQLTKGNMLLWLEKLNSANMMEATGKKQTNPTCLLRGEVSGAMSLLPTALPYSVSLCQKNLYLLSLIRYATPVMRYHFPVTSPTIYLFPKSVNKLLKARENSEREEKQKENSEIKENAKMKT